MPRLTVHHSGEKRCFNVSKGTPLLEGLRFNNFDIFSPCGGAGTCGKCIVLISDLGYVTSCIYDVYKDLEIEIPDTLDLEILTAQYEYSREIVLNPGSVLHLANNPCGLAIDLGTTTVAFHLIELKSGSILGTRTAKNPQTKFGADVISRINYSILKPNGLFDLQDAILKMINQQLDLFAQDFKLEPNDIVRLTVSGNSTMLHILMGVSPKSLAFSPFKTVFTETKLVNASQLGLRCNSRAKMKLLPSLSAYIGADIVAGLASLQPRSEHFNFLFIDIGTNGEIALITPDRIYCCATAAGPAFEAANIECGSGAVKGAIRMYEGPENYLTIGGAKPIGICGSGLIDIVSSFLRNGIITDDGYMGESYIVTPAKNSGTHHDIFVTPKDIREIQLAKSAIATGINLIIKKAGLTLQDLDALYLAGGFGNSIRTESAIAIGLIPRQLKNKVVPVGNTSGTGAVFSIQSIDFDEIIQQTRSRMLSVELADDENFYEEFAMNMTLSNKRYD